jgi:tRNA(Arg) A34 adenosine deaminase TadA
MEPSSEYQRLLRRAFTLARFARNRGNPPYGAICARNNGTVVAEGENSEREDRGDLTCHAEMNAIRDVSRELTRDAIAELTLYASSEPCPMCAGAIALAGIRRVVYGAGAARLAAQTGGSAVGCREIFSLMGASIEVIGPSLEGEALAELERR